MLSKGYLGDLEGDTSRRSEVRPNRDLPRIIVTLDERLVDRVDENVCIIHSIHGGLGLNGKLSNARKRYIKEVWKEMGVGVYSLQRKHSATLITFNEDDVTCPYENPLVVTVRFGSCDVCHILVDKGAWLTCCSYPPSMHWAYVRRTS